MIESGGSGVRYIIDEFDFIKQKGATGTSMLIRHRDMIPRQETNTERVPKRASCPNH